MGWGVQSSRKSYDKTGEKRHTDTWYIFIPLQARGLVYEAASALKMGMRARAQAAQKASPEERHTHKRVEACAHMSNKRDELGAASAKADWQICNYSVDGTFSETKKRGVLEGEFLQTCTLILAVALWSLLVNSQRLKSASVFRLVFLFATCHMSLCLE